MFIISHILLWGLNNHKVGQKIVRWANNHKVGQKIVRWAIGIQMTSIWLTIVVHKLLKVFFCLCFAELDTLLASPCCS